jgi:hypothetical protein
MPAYKPTQFWEESHSAVAAQDVNLGSGVRYVGGGQSALEAQALYRLRNLNARRILQASKLPPRAKIFELGSGGGYWVAFFQAFNPSVYVGSDLSTTAVERLSTIYPGHEFVQLVPADEGWSQIRGFGPYDLTLAIDVLYHITDDIAWTQSLERLCTNTIAGGLLLITDYFYEQPTDQPTKVHVKHRKMQEYLDVLAKYEFHVEAIQPMFYFLNRIISGPWRDHSRLLSPVLRTLSASSLGLKALGAVDAIATAVLRPMHPRCKMRFLLARRSDG